MSLRFRVVFATACALLIALLCVGYADSVKAEAEQVRSEAIARFGGEVARVVVTNVALEPGEVVSEKDVALREWVSQLVPEGALTSVDDVVGREVTVPVSKNAPVCELAFRDDGALLDVPAGHVALSIPVTDRLGVSRTVSQGARAIAYRIDNAQTTQISGDVQVLSSPSGATGVVSGVQLTIAVPSNDVSGVLAASAAGSLRLVLPAEDVDASKTGESQTAAPAPLDAAEKSEEGK